MFRPEGSPRAINDKDTDKYSTAYRHKRSAVQHVAASKPVTCGKMMALKHAIQCILCPGHSSPRWVITCVFRACCEGWEKTRFTSMGCQILEFQFFRRHSGLMFTDVGTDGLIGCRTEKDLQHFRGVTRANKRRQL